MKTDGHYDYCFHTHTSRCGHAYGTDREYFETAARDGYKYLGFTDHVMLPMMSQKGTRGDYALFPDYVSSLNSLREEFKGQLKVLLGFECEYSKEFLPYYESLLSSKTLDYLILGQHAHYDKKANRMSYYGDMERSAALDSYVNDSIEAMETGLFKYFAHPDLIMTSMKTWDSKVEKKMAVLIEKAMEKGIVLEINMGRTRINGYKEGQDVSMAEYPCLEFWKLAARMGAKAMVGVDAHSPWDLHLGPFAYIRDIIEKSGIQLIGPEDFLGKLAEEC